MRSKKAKVPRPADMPSSKKLITALWPYFAPDVNLVGVGLLALLASSYSNNILPRILRKVIDAKVSGGEEGDRSGRNIYQKAGWIFVIGAVGSYVRTRCKGTVEARVAERVRLKLFKALMKQEAAFFDSDASGAAAEANREVAALSSPGDDSSSSHAVSESKEEKRREVTKAMVDEWLRQDVDNLTSKILTNGTNLIRYSTSVVMGTTAIVQMGGKATRRFASVTLGLVAVVVPAVVLRYSKYNKAVRDRDAAQVRAADFVFEKFDAIRTIRSYAREEHEIEAYGRKVADILAHEVNTAGANGALMATMDLGFKAAMIVVVAFGSKLANQGELTAGDLTQFVTAGMMAGAGFGGLLRMANDDWQTAAWRVLRIIHRKPQLPLQSAASANGNTTHNSRLQGHIVFEGVDFAYPCVSAGLKVSLDGAKSADVVEEQSHLTEMLTLSNFCLEAQPGQVVALMGPSGSGKTTVGRLLLGLYQSTRGRILLDGKDIQSFDPSWLRGSQIAVVEQEPRIFSCSVRENIRYGALDADDAAVEIAAKVANVHEVIMDLENNYDTKLGKGGLALSGGQKQKISIARAVIKNPAILLLDEGTSALPDQVSQK